MFIGLDIRAVQSLESRHRGIGEYGRNLLKYLLIENASWNFVLFCSKRDPLIDLNLFQNTKLFYLRRAPRLVLLQDQIFLPFEILSKKIDLFHALIPNLPFLKTAKTVVTVHDIIPLIFPQYYLRRRAVRLWYYSQLKILKQANRIIAISEYTKQDLIRLLDLPEEKVKVIYYGLNSIYRSAINEKEWSKIKDEFKIDKEYILYAGGFDERKNIPFLITAFKGVKENIDVLLILVGMYKNRDFYIFKLIKDLGLEKDIIFTGYMEPEKLHILYKFALALVFPSLYEGFGLPLIEAMASGCPVVALNTSSIPEIIADAGLLVERDDREGFIKAIISIIGDKKLRAEFIDKGLKRTEDFSWEKAAEKTLETYQEVLNE